MGQNKIMYLGIDVSKGYADFCIMDQQKLCLEKNFQLDDNREGHQLLQKYLENYLSSGYGIICGVESTGGYEQNWQSLLKGIEGVEVFKLNPKGIKHQIESTLKRTITDSVSAQGIADYLANNYEKLEQNWRQSTNQDDSIIASQRCLRMIMGLIKQQTVRYNQLEKMLYQDFSELLTYCKNGIPNWMLRLLIRYPGLNAIKSAYVKGISGIKGISLKKAEEIKQHAKHSVSKPLDPLVQVVIKTLAEDISYHQQRIEQLKVLLISNYKSHNLNLIKSIRGIADYTAAALLLLLGDIQRFTDTNHLAAFYGVHPKFKQSGDGKWSSRMSKQGNSAIRAILYVAANNVIIHEPYFKELYQHHLSKGKKSRAVIGIIMHKLLRIVYGMLKNQTQFDSSVDERNRENTIENKVQLINSNARRYQEISIHAPISRSNYKKRRAVLECQISEIDINTASS
jgi:transposase